MLNEPTQFSVNPLAEANEIHQNVGLFIEAGIYGPHSALVTSMARRKEKQADSDSFLGRIKRLLRIDSDPPKKMMKLEDVGKEVPPKADHDSAASANQALEDLLKKRG